MEYPQFENMTVKKSTREFEMLLIDWVANEKGSVLHNITKQLTAANANATIVSIGVSILVVREVDSAARLSATSIR